MMIKEKYLKTRINYRNAFLLLFVFLNVIILLLIYFWWFRDDKQESNQFPYNGTSVFEDTTIKYFGDTSVFNEIDNLKCITKARPDIDSFNCYYVNKQRYKFIALATQDLILFYKFMEFLRKTDGVAEENVVILNEKGKYVGTLDSFWVMPTRVEVYSHPIYFQDSLTGKIYQRQW